MKFGLNLGRKNQYEIQKERNKVLGFIQNHAAKKDFIDWLNANYNHQFSEDADWDNIVKKVKDNEAVHNAALQNYASTLTEDEDVTKLLKDVEKETAKAEETVSKLYDASSFRRMRPVVGGACLLGGFLLLVVAAGVFTDAMEFDLSAEVRNLLAILGGLYGFVNIVAGFLLVLE